MCEDDKSARMNELELCGKFENYDDKNFTCGHPRDKG